jgi:CRP/FNR family transcriptional regulator, cyclic AMP receptor protein
LLSAVSVFKPKVDSDVVEMMAKVPIFTGMTDRQLHGLAKYAAGREYAEGATIVKQGEKGVGFYLILDGGVEVRGKSRRLATLHSGDFFGEMALFEQQPRSADVIALRKTRCLVLSRWEFWGFAMDKPRLLRGIIEELARRLGDTNRALTE